MLFSGNIISGSIYFLILQYILLEKILHRFIARRLELADIEFKRINYEQELTEFVRDYIKMDGVFMLRMLTIHSGILVCTEVVDSMWEEFNRSSSKQYFYIKIENLLQNLLLPS